ncbi:MAG: hypothetical protein AB1564_12880 [Chloroflexota bacterium]
MAQAKEIEIPIICENNQCQNFGKTINVVYEVKLKELDLFYENYDGSVEEDYCFVCGELGVAEDAIMK